MLCIMKLWYNRTEHLRFQVLKIITYKYMYVEGLLQQRPLVTSRMWRKQVIKTLCSYSRTRARWVQKNSTDLQHTQLHITKLWMIVLRPKEIQQNTCPLFVSIINRSGGVYKPQHMMDHCYLYPENRHLLFEYL